MDEKIIGQLQALPPAPCSEATDPTPQKETPASTQDPESYAPSKKRTKRAGTGGNPLPVDIRPQLAKIMGVDLTLIPGLNAVGVLILLSEIGTDLRRWRDGGAFAAWLGLAPGSKISGGKVLSSRTPHVMNRVAILLRLSALAIGRTDTCLGAFYRRIKARHGAPKAMTATARKLAELIYLLMTQHKEFVQMDAKEYEQRVLKQKLIRLSREAKKLGFDLVPLQMADSNAKPSQTPA